MVKEVGEDFFVILFCNAKYLSGFGNEFASEALPDALPKGQVSDFTCPRGAHFHKLLWLEFALSCLLSLA